MACETIMQKLLKSPMICLETPADFYEWEMRELARRCGTEVDEQSMHDTLALFRGVTTASRNYYTRLLSQ